MSIFMAYLITCLGNTVLEIGLHAENYLAFWKLLSDTT